MPTQTLIPIRSWKFCWRWSWYVFTIVHHMLRLKLVKCTSSSVRIIITLMMNYPNSLRLKFTLLQYLASSRLRYIRFLFSISKWHVFFDSILKNHLFNIIPSFGFKFWEKTYFLKFSLKSGDNYKYLLLASWEFLRKLERVQEVNLLFQRFCCQFSWLLKFICQLICPSNEHQQFLL